MSDGGISFAKAFSYESNELSKSVLVNPAWLANLLAARYDLKNKVSNAFRHCKPAYRDGETIKPTTMSPDEGWRGLVGDWIHDKDETRFIKFLESEASGNTLFPEWYYDRDEIVEAIHKYNNAVDWAWESQLGFGDQAPSKRAERRKAGYTKELTPKQFKKHRRLLKKFNLNPSVYTNVIWREEIQVFMDFLMEGKLPDGVSMDKNKPKLRHRVAGNILWFLQEVLGWVTTDEVDVCSDCGCLILTDRETHDWCSKCGKMRCESCTTAPSHCQCDHPCGKHCTCGRNEVGRL
ncbi:MAG: hypothetical protein KGL39_40135 [Patescibacteria group bacterium]|nr:hypothetical protein [Patescibacteria group bacterium]